MHKNPLAESRITGIGRGIGERINKYKTTTDIEVLIWALYYQWRRSA